MPPVPPWLLLLLLLLLLRSLICGAFSKRTR